MGTFIELESGPLSYGTPVSERGYQRSNCDRSIERPLDAAVIAHVGSSSGEQLNSLTSDL